MYFMNDKVFGTVAGHPLWAIYNCGTDIQGEIDIAGDFHDFSFAYHREGPRMITGRFGKIEMGLGAIRRTDEGFTYDVYFGEQIYPFTIRYEKLDGDHLLNSIIEGELPGAKPVRLTVDGSLCPFATTGIILITAGAESIAD